MVRGVFVDALCRVLFGRVVNLRIVLASIIQERLSSRDRINLPSGLLEQVLSWKVHRTSSRRIIEKRPSFA